MTYKCVCGQEFDNPQKFNRHKAFCRVHIESKGINYDEYVKKIAMKKSEASKLNAKLRKERLEQEKCDALKQWIVEQHTCEKCGKIMTEKYGSGRFCSKQCANTRCHSSKTKKKISDKMKVSSSFLNEAFNSDTHKLAGESLHKNRVDKYNKSPSLCIVCGKELTYELRHRATCSQQCSKLAHGGTRISDSNCYKYGYYQGIECDSSYELAFLVYCLSYNIPIIRNVERFIYEIDGQEHIYLPDFKINNTYVEIKGYDTPSVTLKANVMKSKNLPYLLLFGKDIQPCIDYCIEKYGKKYWEVLYDKDKPSCNDKKQA